MERSAALDARGERHVAADQGAVVAGRCVPFGLAGKPEQLWQAALRVVGSRVQPRVLTAMGPSGIL